MPSNSLVANGLRARVIDAFERQFGASPVLAARAPGRINLIGEHTDYNEGFVLPVAIDRDVWIAFSPLATPQVEARSLDFTAVANFRVDDRISHGESWTEYVRGVAWALREAGYPLAGWRGVVASNVPVGAGLSSSAALELAVARVFASLAGDHWDPVAMARVTQRAENQWVGVHCGIMDQLVSAAGKEGHALLIDCRSLEARAVPMPPFAAVVVLDTATRRGLVNSAYNERRAQCEQAACVFGVAALRDVTENDFAVGAARLDPVIRQRARHVVTENARTLRAADALARGDIADVGRLMNASHASLRDHFEVSGPELDVMARIAQDHAACFGARMTGAGFGGCVIALVQTNVADAFAADVVRAYATETGLTPSAHICETAAGASLEVLS